MHDLTPSHFFTLPDGRRLRCAHIRPTGEIKGTFIIAPGRREFIEKKQAEWQEELSQRGFAQIYFEWFGQGLSDRPLGGDLYQRDHCAYPADFDRHLDDFRAFFRDVVQPEATSPLFITGHSLGGHLMLRWLAEDRPQSVTAAIFTAPMMTIGTALMLQTSRLLSPLATKRGREADYAVGQHDYDDSDRRFMLNPLSQDPERFAIMEHCFAAHPDLTVGGVTWGWLEAATRSVNLTRQAGYLAQITTPTLIMTGDHDVVTPPRSMAKFLNTIPHVDDVMIEDARHDVMNESEDLRRTAWHHIDRFLGRVLLNQP